MQPFIKPILRIVSENVTKSSAIVMTDVAQYVVWNDPNSSDPTHSLLAKDHFRYTNLMIILTAVAI